MTRLLAVESPDRWPRCPRCDAVAYPAWATGHRPGCPMTHTDPATWPTERTTP